MRAQSALAQFGLSRTEVERWLRENAEQYHEISEPQLASSGFGTPHSSSEDSYAAQSVGHSSLSASSQSSRRWPLNTLLAEALAGSQCSVSSQHLPSETRTPISPRRVHTQRRLETFERQINVVVQQANALRSESVELRHQAYVSPGEQNRIDALLSQLSCAMHGVMIGPVDLTQRQRAPVQYGSEFQQQGGHPMPTTAGARPILPSDDFIPPPNPVQHEMLMDQRQGINRAGEHERQIGPRGFGQYELRPAQPNVEQPNQPGRARPRRRNHKQEQLNILRRWFDEHINEPYPSPEEKIMLASQVGMEVRQIEHCALQAIDVPIGGTICHACRSAC